MKGRKRGGEDLYMQAKNNTPTEVGASFRLGTTGATLSGRPPAMPTDYDLYYP